MNNTVIGILVAVVIVVVGWIAYTQGVFDSKDAADDNDGGVEVNVGGSGDTTPEPTGY